MTEEQIDPPRADDDLRSDDTAGTAAANPVSGVEMDEEQHEDAVEPDDEELPLDGPQPGHA